MRDIFLKTESGQALPKSEHTEEPINPQLGNSGVKDLENNTESTSIKAKNASQNKLSKQLKSSRRSLIIIDKKVLLIGILFHFLSLEIVCLVIAELYNWYLSSPLNRFHIGDPASILYDGGKLSYAIAFSWSLPATVYLISRLNPANKQSNNMTVYYVSMFFRYLFYFPVMFFIISTNPAIHEIDTVNEVASMLHIHPFIIMDAEALCIMVIFLLIATIVSLMSKHSFIGKKDLYPYPAPDELSKFELELSKVAANASKYQSNGLDNIPIFSTYLDYKRWWATRRVIHRIAHISNGIEKLPETIRVNMMPAWKYRLFFAKNIGIGIFTSGVLLFFSSLYPQFHALKNPVIDSAVHSYYEKLEPVMLGPIGYLYTLILSSMVILFKTSNKIDHSKLRDIYLYISGTYLSNCESSFIIIYFSFLSVNNIFFIDLMNHQLGENAVKGFVYCLNILFLLLFITVYYFTRRSLVTVADKYCISSSGQEVIMRKGSFLPPSRKIYLRYYAVVIFFTPITLLILQAAFRLFAWGGAIILVKIALYLTGHP